MVNVSRTVLLALQAWIVDMFSLVRGTGNQVDWSLVSDRFRRGAFKLTVGSGGIAVGGTSLPVTALTDPLAVGTVIDFGTVTSVTVTLTANALANATSITVSALSAAIPSGTLLYFGTSKYARTTAAVAAAATSISVQALPAALSSGDAATYQGGDKALKVAAAAAVGATSVTVEAAPYAIAAAEVAYPVSSNFSGLRTGAKYIPAGTCVAKLSSGKIIPRVDVTGAETAIGFIETGAASDSETDSLTGYSVLRGGHFNENLLPDADSVTGLISTTYKTEMRTNGGAFVFSKAKDSRGN